MGTMSHETRLAQFMARERIRPSDILSRVSYSRGTLYQLRVGDMRGTPALMGATRAAIVAILGRPVSVEDLFDFDPKNFGKVDAVADASARA
jgi:hypothetical protein